MAQEQNDSRQFLIKHGECRSLFIIDSKNFLKNFKNETPERAYSLRCPNCDKSLLSGDEFKFFLQFLKDYEKYAKKFKDKGYTIREIQPKELDL